MEMISGYISKLRFNSGETMDIRKNDIVVFVGPNNAGKSQSLKDIYSLSSKKMSSIVVSDIEVSKTAGSLYPLLERVSNGIDKGDYIHYSILGHGLVYNKNHSDGLFLRETCFSDFRDLFVVNLDTAARLSICWPPNNINRTDSREHPIHYAAFDGKYRKWLSDSFKKAFGKELTPNTQFGASIPLCIGEQVKLTEEYEDEQQRLEAYASILETYQQVQDQGDGIKSFTGILLYLMLDYYKTFLIDEPESFLHPPQARIMGQIIGNTLSDTQQAFIATHSEDILKGLLEACPQRLKIVRITRNSNSNCFSIINNERFNEVWNDPLLKYSNIMSSLFHKSVVLCESDSDCKMYSIVDAFVKRLDNRYSEALFIHCGGKQRMAKISRALRALNIDVRLILDLDVLNDEGVFRSIIEAYGINWNIIEKDYRIIINNLHSYKEQISRNDVKTTIDGILNSSTDKYLSKKELGDIRDAISTTSKWDILKKYGIIAIPQGDSTNAFKRIDAVLRTNHIYIVPVGELECFVKEVGGHGPEWVNRVLERFPDLNSNEYSQIRDFILSIDI